MSIFIEVNNKKDFKNYRKQITNKKQNPGKFLPGSNYVKNHKQYGLYKK